MTITLEIDETVLREAREVAGALTDSQTVQLGLEALIRHGAYQRLRMLRGSEKVVVDVPRRRELSRNHVRRTRTV